MRARDADSSLSAERVRWLFSYDPQTGGLFWRNKPHPSAGVTIGGAVGQVQNGYLRVWFDRRHWQVHRLVWMYVYGCWPDNFIDHRDRDRTNNKISNLREATYSQNKRNMKVRCESKSGLAGIRLHEGGKWQARISYGGRIISKLFASKEEAIVQRASWAKMVAGEFAP